MSDLAAKKLEKTRQALENRVLSYADSYITRQQIIFGNRSADAKERRKSARAAGETAVQHRAPAVPPLGCEVTAGVGKSHAMTNVIERVVRAGLPVAVLVTSHALADEYVERLQDAGMTPLHYFGRQSETNEINPDLTCYKLDPVAEAGLRNHRPAQSVCRTCPNGRRGMLDHKTGEQAAAAMSWFKKANINPDEIDPCQFLFEGLPRQLAEQLIVMPYQSFSAGTAVWNDPKTGELVERLVIVDEQIPINKAVEIGEGDVLSWRETIKTMTAGLDDRLTRALKHKDDAAQSEVYMLRHLLPEMDALFKQITIDIIGNNVPDAAAINAAWEKIKSHKLMQSGTAPWERVTFDPDTIISDDEKGDFYVPLRALSAIVESLKSGILSVKNEKWVAYELSPVIEWAQSNKSTIFLDGTMPLTMRTLIEAFGGEVYTAKADQNMTVTRVTGHLYARGDVNARGQSKLDYARMARTYMNEIERIAGWLVKQGGEVGILTHKAYLRYSAEEPDTKDAADKVKAEFDARFDQIAQIGWFGRHERGNNQWVGRDLALIGMTILSVDAISKGYGSARAAMALAGVPWPAFDLRMDDGKASGGVRLPMQAEVRRWLVGEYAASVAQGVARNRAVNHVGKPLGVWLFGGLESADMDAELARHGVVIAARIKNQFHRTLAEYRDRGTDVAAIDAAIDAVQAVGGRVSRRSVADALGAVGGHASNAAVVARLDALRAAGQLPPARDGRAPKLVRDAIVYLLLHRGPVSFCEKEKESDGGTAPPRPAHFDSAEAVETLNQEDEAGLFWSSPTAQRGHFGKSFAEMDDAERELALEFFDFPAQIGAPPPALVWICPDSGVIFDQTTRAPWGTRADLYARPRAARGLAGLPGLAGWRPSADAARLPT